MYEAFGNRLVSWIDSKCVKYTGNSSMHLPIPASSRRNHGRTDKISRGRGVVDNINISISIILFDKHKARYKNNSTDRSLDSIAVSVSPFTLLARHPCVYGYSPSDYSTLRVWHLFQVRTSDGRPSNVARRRSYASHALLYGPTTRSATP